MPPEGLLSVPLQRLPASGRGEESRTMRTMARRRKPKPKPGELIIWHGVLERGMEPDLVASWGGQGASKCDGGFVLFELNPADWQIRLDPKKVSIVKELERRGYDLDTLEFRIRQKAPAWRSIVEGA